MFKKKPTIKPLAPLRSSDRRRTADEIIRDLQLQKPSSSPETPDQKAAATAEQTSLRNALLPENTQSARFTTTSGPELKQVSGTVYVGSHDGDADVRVLWVRVGDRMYPTVYTLWHTQNVNIVPLLYTPGIVVQKLQGGADLMIPGLAGGPPFPGKAKKGAVVAVASTDRPGMPAAVGVCEVDVSGLGDVRGMKGVAVKMVHWAGDEIWGWSTGGKPGKDPPDDIEGWGEEDEVGEVAEGVESLQVGENRENGDDETVEDGGVSLKANEEVKLPARNEYVEGEDAENGEAAEAEKEFTTKEIDEAFRKAFLYGVHHHKQTNRDAPNFGLQFPLTQSFVMSNLVQPFLPAFTPAQSNALQIKKTSYKNIKKFIKSLDKQHIIKSKDRDGHEVVILDIDFDDAAILDFKPYRLPKKDTASSSTPSTSKSSSTDPSVGQKLSLLTLYKPKEKLSEIFTSTSNDPRGYYAASEIRTVSTTYVESNNLVSSTNKRLVTLDPILANSVFDGSNRLDAEVLSKGSVPRDTLTDRLIASCAPFHAIVRNPSSSPHTLPPDTKPRAGAPPKITITLETRSGNKTVTKVSGLEAYFIPPQPLADELRKTCAGSTSVEQLKGSSPKNPVMEVMVQGPQREAVGKALEKRGVSRGWVEVVDKTKGKKR